MIPAGFENILDHYAFYNKPPIRLSTINEIVGGSTFDANVKFILARNLAKKQELTKDNCATCGEAATVRDLAEGIVSCRKGHVTKRNPLSLTQLVFSPNSLLALMEEVLRPHLKLLPFQEGEKHDSGFSRCGFEPLGVYDLENLKVLFLVPFKRVRLRDAAMLQGLVTGTPYDSYVLLLEGIDSDAEEFLAYNTGGTAHFVKFDDFFRSNHEVERLVKALGTEISMGSMRLFSFLKRELRKVPSIATPDSFRTIIEYNEKLVNDSFEASKTGRDKEFEDSVANLLGSFLLITPLGHHAAEEGYKREVPDGIIQIPIDRLNRLELMFYDCKSIGTQEKVKRTKRISQSDEDEFARYCSLFASEKMNAELTGGIFVAHDFTAENMVNKALQIRQAGHVPRRIKIIFWPLGSLVRLYARLSQERGKFLLHFEPSALYKLFGTNLTASETRLVGSGPQSDSYTKLRDSDTDAVYVTENLVDVFFNHVYCLPTAESQYLPYVLDLSRRASVTVNQ